MISWNVFGQFGGKLLYPVFQIIIARKLLPEDYGVFLICFIIFSFYSIFKDIGLTDAIIVSKSKEEFVGIQWFMQLVTALIFYFAIYVSADQIAIIFDNPVLGRVLPVFMLAAFVSAYVDPIHTRYLKQQKFKLIALRNILMPFAMGLIGVVLAYSGYGVDALIYSYLGGHLAVALLFFIKEGIVPFRRDVQVIGELMVLGKHILIQRVLGFLVNQSDVVIIGKFLGAAELGIYRIAHQIALLAPQALFPHICQVLFTEFAKFDRDTAVIAESYQKYSWAAGGLLLCYTVVVFIGAESVIPLLLGDKWHGVALIIPILAHTAVTGNMTLLNHEIAKIFGFARYYSIYAVVRALVTVIVLVVAAPYGITVIAVVYLFLAMCFTITNEIIFYLSQNFISLDMGKVTIYVLAIGWAIIIAADALL